MRSDRPVLDLGQIDAVLFDLDGVVTETASVHAAAWKRTFDDYLERRGARCDEEQPPFDIETDYKRYVDGRSRSDGARAFLESRGISLPLGDRNDPPGSETVSALAKRKDDDYRHRLATDGVKPFESTVALLRVLRSRGIRTALFSASRNCVDVIEAAGIRDLFDAKVDGVDAEELGLPGKPDPAVVLEAARRVGVGPERAAVVEDAIAGVEAGRRGGFGLVVGIDRTGNGDGLRSAGADVVVADLAVLRVEPDSGAAGGDLDPADGNRAAGGRRIPGDG